MASPQCENGFLKLAHELVRVFIRTRVSGRVKDSVLAVAERTWGYGLTDAVIPTATLAGDMGMAANDARRVLGQAAALNMIIKTERGKASAPCWRVNKDYDSWLCKVRVWKPKASTASLDELKKRIGGGQTATPSEDEKTADGGAKQPPFLIRDKKRVLLYLRKGRGATGETQQQQNVSRSNRKKKKPHPPTSTCSPRTTSNVSGRGWVRPTGMGSRPRAVCWRNVSLLRTIRPT